MREGGDVGRCRGSSGSAMAWDLEGWSAVVCRGSGDNWLVIEIDVTGVTLLAVRPQYLDEVAEGVAHGGLRRRRSWKQRRRKDGSKGSL